MFRVIVHLEANDAPVKGDICYGKLSVRIFHVSELRKKDRAAK